jgi:IS5 family transposase
LRPQANPQIGIEFSDPHLKLTREYYAKYDAMSSLLDQAPELLGRVHQDLTKPLQALRENARGGRSSTFTSENVLRILVCQVVEGLSLREVVVRVDDSQFLRQFVRIHGGPMMDFTTLCKLKNAIPPETWAQVNRQLAELAARQQQIEGRRLRIDTTAVETNIHYPTDSSLLWDLYRVLARAIAQARTIAPGAVGSGRLQTRRVKRLQQQIGRAAGAKGGRRGRTLKRLYQRLIRRVERVSSWARSVRDELERENHRGSAFNLAVAEGLIREIDGWLALAPRVIDQARRRVLQGESVPNDEKLFSIFEAHTELLKRGKAGKEVEFGHMIQIQQVASKFITDYEVFRWRPAEPGLVDAALESHKDLFGSYPEALTGDKGYYGGMPALDALGDKVDLVAIAKKGRRTLAETEREHDPLFRHAQRFRAGVEGTISFLKRVLRLARCFNKGWKHFVATVGQTVFAHNLLVLTRC